MEEQSTNPRSIRLKQFIDTTGMSLSEFAKQCELSSITTIHQVVKHHKQPTDKVLKKIIKRFPQLSYDWILLGVGEMLVMGANDNQSGHSVKTSTQATFSDISSKLELHDHALNELNNRINESMANLDKKADLVSQTVATMNIKIDKIVFDAKEYVEDHAEQNERGMEAALNMIVTFEKRLVNQMEQINKSQNASDARAEESLKAGMALVESINQTKEEGLKMIKIVQNQSDTAIELGERAIKENKATLKSFGKGLEGYAKERDKKAEEITLHNVEKLFQQLLEQKGLGTYTKVKKS